MAFLITPPSNTSNSIGTEQQNHLLNPFSRPQITKPQRISFTTDNFPNSRRNKTSLLAMATTQVKSLDLAQNDHPKTIGPPIMVNGCTGKVGRAVLEAAVSAGLRPVPVVLGGPGDAGKIIDIDGMKIEVQVCDASEREEILASVLKEYPDLIVVDYTVPAAVNDNAALYTRVGVPFVMGTTGGDRELLYKTVADSNIYALISPQMGKQVVAFLAAMEIMAKQFPGAFSGYNLDVIESHQASKLDLSGTAKAVISCFQELGVSFDLEQVNQVRDPKLQVEMLGVPEEHLNGHAFHTYHLTSPDGTSIYAEGTVDAILFLAKKIKEKADKKIYDMIDVLREGNMR